MNNDIEKSKIAKTIKEAKDRLKKAKSGEVFRNTQKAKTKRGY